MSNSINPATAAIVAASGAAGAAGGYALSRGPVKQILANVQGVDTYINTAIENNMDKVHSTLKQSKWADAFAKITQKAKAEYAAVLEKAKNVAKSTTTKYVAVAGAAGAVIAAATIAIVKTIKNKKAEKAEA